MHAPGDPCDKNGGVCPFDIAAMSDKRAREESDGVPLAKKAFVAWKCPAVGCDYQTERPSQRTGHTCVPAMQTEAAAVPKEAATEKVAAVEAEAAAAEAVDSWIPPPPPPAEERLLRCAAASECGERNTFSSITQLTNHAELMHPHLYRANSEKLNAAARLMEEALDVICAPAVDPNLVACPADGCTFSSVATADLMVHMRSHM